MRSLVCTSLLRSLAHTGEFLSSVVPSKVDVVGRAASASLNTRGEVHDAWSISPDVSALRATTIVALLQALVPYEGLEFGLRCVVASLILLYTEKADNVQTVSAFYTASVAQCVGDSFQSPSIPFLARVWLNSRGTSI